MPATVTHAFFTIDVYQKLRKKEQLLDSKALQQLKMFGQSMDSMMFYNVESLHKGKQLRNFRYYFHLNSSQDFFLSLCSNILEKKLDKDPEVLAFLYGFICHYVLDSTVHPFVIYQSGFMDKKKKETYRYNGIHTYMETSIDNELTLLRTNKNPYSFRLDQFCFDTTPFSENLQGVINDVFLDVFSMKDMSTIYYRSLRQMKRFVRKYRYDRFGIKRLGYRIIDSFTKDAVFRFQSLSYHYPRTYKDYFLNSDHQIWYYSMDPSISSHESFFDLYEKSIQEACDMISKVRDFFDGKKVDLKKVFTNKSYVTGLDCNRKPDFKKFRF